MCRYLRTVASSCSPPGRMDCGFAISVRSSGGVCPAPRVVSTPFWSPDGRYLGFSVGHEVKKVDVAGGPPETLCTLPADAGGFGSWNRNGDIVLGSWGGGSGGPLWKLSQAGGAATAVTEVDVARRRVVSHVAHVPSRRLAFSVLPLRTAGSAGDVRGFPRRRARGAIAPTALAERGAGRLCERLHLLHARRHADGAAVRRSAPAAPGRAGARGRRHSDHLVLRRSVFGLRRRRARLSRRVADRNRSARLDRSTRTDARRVWNAQYGHEPCVVARWETCGCEGFSVRRAR